MGVKLTFDHFQVLISRERKGKLEGSEGVKNERRRDGQRWVCCG